MAVRIPYEYVEYNFNRTGKPIPEDEYYEIQRVGIEAYLKALKIKLKSEFIKTQGTFGRISYYMLHIYFFIIMSMIVSGFLGSDTISKLTDGDITATIMGIIMLFGFITFPLGLGYRKSKKSFKEYMVNLMSYYKSQYLIIDKTDDYNTYLEAFHKLR